VSSGGWGIGGGATPPVVRGLRGGVFCLDLTMLGAEIFLPVLSWFALTLLYLKRPYRGRPISGFNFTIRYMHHG